MRTTLKWIGIFLLPVLVLALFVPINAHGQAGMTLLGLGVMGTTLASGNPTLLDLAKLLDPNGATADVVEILNQINEILLDMTWKEGNLITGHQSTVRTGIPTPTWRKMYGAVAESKGTVSKVTDTCGMLEAYAKVDFAEAELNGFKAAWRLSEDAAHIEGMSEEIARALFYGNETTQPEAFTGLAPRFNTVSVATAQSADNVIDHGGTGTDNTSVWLCVWGPKTGFGIIPQGTKAGIQVEDLGDQLIQEAGGQWRALVTHYRMNAGLTIRDWRYFVRVANIDVSDLATVANTSALITSMIRASERIPSFGAGRAAWYVPRVVRESLRLGIQNKIANNLTWENVEGKRIMTFDGIPVRRCDQILLTEARVV